MSTSSCGGAGVPDSSGSFPNCLNGPAGYGLSDYMYVTGGYAYIFDGAPTSKFANQSYRSSGGVGTFTHLGQANYMPLGYMAYAYFEGRMWMMGGYNGTYQNDTYYSTDALTWTRVSRGPWMPRGHLNAYVFNGKMWIAGGTNVTQGMDDLWFMTPANVSTGTWTRQSGAMTGIAGTVLQGISNERPLFAFNDSVMFVHVGYNNQTYYTEDEGVTWASLGAPDPLMKRYGAAWGYINGAWTALGGYSYDGTGPLHYSATTTDGKTWHLGNESVAWGSAFFPLVRYTAPLASTAPWKTKEALYGLSQNEGGIAPNADGAVTVTVPPPIPQATPETAQGSVPLAVAWTDQSTGYITTWAWDFKDGYLSYVPDASHTFSAEGTYLVTLTTGSSFGTSVWVSTVAVSTQQQQVIYYTQKQVKIHIVDAYGNPIPRANVTASYIASQLPSTDIPWLVSAFGITSDVAQEMLNGSVAMQGWTGDDGSTVFTMFPSLTYGISIQNLTLGLNNYRTLAPAEADYTIYCPLSGQRAASSFTSQLANTSLWYTIPDANHMTFCGGYRDISGYTTGLRFNIWKWSNMTSMAGLPLQVYTYNFGPVSSSAYVQDCNWTVPIVNGDEYKWQWNITRSQWV